MESTSTEDENAEAVKHKQEAAQVHVGLVLPLVSISTLKKEETMKSKKKLRSNTKSNKQVPAGLLHMGNAQSMAILNKLFDRDPAELKRKLHEKIEAAKSVNEDIPWHVLADLDSEATGQIL